MIKKFLALALLITSFMLAGNAYGEDEVYYCADIATTGFDFDKKSNSYQPARIFGKKFKLKLDKTSNHIEIAYEDGSKERHNCMALSKELFICVERFNSINFNTENGRFIHATAFGYVVMDGDTISISYGKCDKF